MKFKISYFSLIMTPRVNYDSETHRITLKKAVKFYCEPRKKSEVKKLVFLTRDLILNLRDGKIILR